MFVLLASGSFHLALQVAVRGRSLSTASGYLLVLDRCSQVQATVLVGSKQSERCYVKAVEDGGVFLQNHTIHFPFVLLPWFTSFVCFRQQRTFVAD